VSDEGERKKWGSRGKKLEIGDRDLRVVEHLVKKGEESQNLKNRRISRGSPPGGGFNFETEKDDKLDTRPESPNDRNDRAGENRSSSAG